MDPDTLFGDIVKQYRQHLDLTQAELARRVACATITIRKIEYNSLRPSIQIAERLATSLKIPLEEQAAFVRLARSSLLTTPTPQPLPTPPPTPEEIGLEDLSGRAIRGYELSDRIGRGRIWRRLPRRTTAHRARGGGQDHPAPLRRPPGIHPPLRSRSTAGRPPGAPPHRAALRLLARARAAFLVMRLMRGGSLHSLLKDVPLSLDFILQLLNQVGAALFSAHRKGIIHRDLKPTNILLDEDQNTYLADFGVAKNLGSPVQSSDTMLAGIIGSPAYVSPEQLSRRSYPAPGGHLFPGCAAV